MLEDPLYDYPQTEGKSCVCLEKGQYCAYLDWNAALELLFSLHWIAKEKPLGEEVDIWTHHSGEMPCKGKSIGLCELNTVPAHKHKKQGKNILKQAQTIRHKPHGIYTEEDDRLDYFVSTEEVEVAYKALAMLLTDADDRKPVRETTLFETLVVRLVTL